MKYMNSKDVQVVVYSATKAYYLPPKSSMNIEEKILELPEGVKVVVNKSKLNQLQLKKVNKK